MNKCFLFILAIFLLQSAFAQLPSFSEVAPSVLYAGMDNPVPIMLNGVDPELVNCKVSQAQRVSKYNDSLYAVYPGSIENSVTVKLYFRNIIVEQKNLQVLPPLQLKLHLENEGNGQIKRQELMTQEGFVFRSVQGLLVEGLAFKLISGGLTIFGPNGQVIFSSNMRDAAFNQQIKEHFKSIPAGSRIALSNPRIINQYNQTVQVEPYREWVIFE